jgi:hypothetical protein
MWSEPLNAVTESVASHTVRVVVRDGIGRTVAEVLCAHNADAGFGVFGTMRIVAAGGGPRQRLRACVLLTREALRYAESLGITHVHTDAPARLVPLAARLSGMAGEDAGAMRRFSGELHVARTATLSESDADGLLTRASAAEVTALDAAISVSR